MSWQTLLALTLLCLAIQAFFTMVEMACVSFNKVRLEYFVSCGNRRAKWLSRLISRPSILFGTSMLGVNTAMLLGSECARRLYTSFDINPDFSALTQVIVVVIFAEVTPMFAGRKFAEHAAMIGLPIFYGFSLLARPILSFFNLLSLLVNRVMKTPKESSLFLSREEIQKVLEERDEVMAVSGEPKEFDEVVANIFSLKNKTAEELMQRLEVTEAISSLCTVREMRGLFSAKPFAFLPIYHRHKSNIVAIAYPKQCLKAKDHEKVREHALYPWFILKTMSVLEVLKQFRCNHQIVAVVLDTKGDSIGILTLDAIIDSIFSQRDNWLSIDSSDSHLAQVIIDRSFSGDALLAELKEFYHIDLHYENVKTLEELCAHLLGHNPSKGDVLKIEEYELTIEEAPLIGSCIVGIRTLS